MRQKVRRHRLIQAWFSKQKQSFIRSGLMADPASIVPRQNHTERVLTAWIYPPLQKTEDPYFQERGPGCPLPSEVALV